MEYNTLNGASELSFYAIKLASYMLALSPSSDL